ncbi:MAG TPA: Hsp33 family molecular chaperone HslO [Ottowia sp.]|uniref:Hsp33 family molecular chaperone HslO n=1 Tax=Ottowia sp. TaxID=1898956 RepID=UPI002C6E28FE|nr:Hsp33 family molecular chaperone HslO [Ottowia sp.]HMN21185.1 Hsp33 family molecular chaperone HslO [Ottowia sp.]
MGELHKFIFDGLPVRGQLVRLTDAWQELLARRAANTETGAYPAPVAGVLGELAAVAVLMQGSIKFDGALVLQIQGDGPLKLAVAEVQADLRLRATATLTGPVAPGLPLSDLVNAHGQGRCAITLDPRAPGQHPYQGVVPLVDAQGRRLERVGAMVEHYMRQSEQLDTALVLAADDRVAAGLLLQRLPAPAQAGTAEEGEDDFARLSLLARSLRHEELLDLDADTVLRRLFWDERLLRLDRLQGARGPRFACSCSRARMAAMLTGLGRNEVESVLDERGQVEVGCDFCGRQERFDAVDVARLFTPAEQRVPQPPAVQ